MGPGPRPERRRSSRKENQAIRRHYAARRRREEAKEAADSASAARLLAALDALDPGRQGAGLKQARDRAALSGEAADRAAARLVREGVVEKVEVEVTVGCGARRRVRGLKRRGLSG